MDSFSSAASNGSSSSQFSTEDFMDKLKAQLAEAYAEEFLESKVLELGDLKNAAEAVIFGAYRGATILRDCKGEVFREVHHKARHEPKRKRG